MGWTTSRRRDELPSNWQQLRRQTFTRCGGICEHREPDGQRCTNRATDCDHIKRGNDHSLDNLQGLCSEHHKAKTQREAKQSQRARYIEARKRPQEDHPGIL